MNRFKPQKSFNFIQKKRETISLCTNLLSIGSITNLSHEREVAAAKWPLVCDLGSSEFYLWISQCQASCLRWPSAQRICVEQISGIVPGEGIRCPRCGDVTEIRESIAVTDRMRKRPYFYFRWFFRKYSMQHEIYFAG